jgi:hypothetical protein
MYAGDVEQAVAAEIARRAATRAATEAYHERRLVGSDGERIDTEWGWYQRHDPLHFVWVEYEVLRRRNDGYWRCSLCWHIAGTDQTRPAEHHCRS